MKFYKYDYVVCGGKCMNKPSALVRARNFWKRFVNKRTCLCTESMEEKGGRPENVSFLRIIAKLLRKLL